MSAQKSTSHEDLKQDLKAFQQDVRALRDEVQLKLHLTGMDLREEWENLAPQLDRALDSAAHVSGEVVTDLKRRLNELRKRLGPN